MSTYDEITKTKYVIHVQLQIHWFSIFNSFMMVIFLTGLVSMILMRTLRNDYAKYAREEDDLETLVLFLPLIIVGIFIASARLSVCNLNAPSTMSLG